MAALIAVTAIAFFLMRRRVWRAGTADGGTWRGRLAGTAILLALAPLSFLIIGDMPRDLLSTNTARELAGNGGYEFCRAFRANELDYHNFYATIDQSQLAPEIRADFERAPA